MRRAIAAAIAVSAALACAAVAEAAPFTTIQRTIQDCDGDNLLEFAPGERHVDVSSSVPESCEQDQAGPTPRFARSDSLVNFLQLTDFQIVDEESPGRVEFLDTTQRAPGLNPFSAAYRPQESLTTQITEAMVRQARNTVSPLTSAPLDLTILTGDNADSQQYNETRWFIDTLDGTTGGEDPDPEMHAGVTNDRKIVPDSGIESDIPTTCSPAEQLAYQDNESPYDGVRNDGRPGPDTGYYEPDDSAGDKDDGDGYSPDRNRNQAEVPGPQGDVTVRDFPGLLEAAQRPFEAVGLDMPWYSAFGNHDAQVQGNSGAAYRGPNDPDDTEEVNPVYDAIVRGCLKPNRLPGIVPPPGVPPEEDFLQNPIATLANSFVVPPDPRRCHLAKSNPEDAAAPCDEKGWIEEHSRTTGAPVGHGFEEFTVNGQTGAGRPPPARENHDGYYSFKPKKGFRFIVLDTVTDDCPNEPACSEGSLDDAQYDWLEGEIAAANTAGEYVLVFSHHTERTMRFLSSDTGEQPTHCGERIDRKDNQPACPNPADPTLEDLLCSHDNVLAHVAGHEHQNYTLQHKCEDTGQPQNPYWEISTAAHIDWPQQSRTIEVVQTSPSTMALVLTILDHNGPAHPGGPGPEQFGQGNAGEQVSRLASIGREVAYNDYQGSRGARGRRQDRNVIVPVAKPPPAP